MSVSLRTEENVPYSTRDNLKYAGYKAGQLASRTVGVVCVGSAAVGGLLATVGLAATGFTAAITGPVCMVSSVKTPTEGSDLREVCTFIRVPALLATAGIALCGAGIGLAAASLRIHDYCTNGLTQLEESHKMPDATYSPRIAR